MNILLAILLALSIIGMVFCWVLLRTAAQAASDEVRDAYRDAGYTELEIDTHFNAPRNRGTNAAVPPKVCGVCGQPLKHHDDTSCDKCGSTDFET